MARSPLKRTTAALAVSAALSVPVGGAVFLLAPAPAQAAPGPAAGNAIVIDPADPTPPVRVHEVSAREHIAIIPNEASQSLLDGYPVDKKVTFNPSRPIVVDFGAPYGRIIVDTTGRAESSDPGVRVHQIGPQDILYIRSLDELFGITPEEPEPTDPAPEPEPTEPEPTEPEPPEPEPTESESPEPEPTESESPAPEQPTDGPTPTPSETPSGPTRSPDPPGPTSPARPTSPGGTTDPAGPSAPPAPTTPSDRPAAPERPTSTERPSSPERPTTPERTQSPGRSGGDDQGAGEDGTGERSRSSGQQGGGSSPRPDSPEPQASEPRSDPARRDALEDATAPASPAAAERQRERAEEDVPDRPNQPAAPPAEQARRVEEQDAAESSSSSQPSESTEDSSPTADPAQSNPFGIPQLPDRQTQAEKDSAGPIADLIDTFSSDPAKGFSQVRTVLLLTLAIGFLTASGFVVATWHGQRITGGSTPQGGLKGFFQWVTDLFRP